MGGEFFSFQMFEKFIAPSMKDADIVVPWGNATLEIIP